MLTELGLEHRTDEREDILFTYAKGSFYVVFSPNDGDYLRLVYPYFWEAGSERERRLALEAANVANQKIKIAKIILLDGKALAVVETYIPDIAGLRRRLPQFLELILVGCDEFIAYLDQADGLTGNTSLN